MISKARKHGFSEAQDDMRDKAVDEYEIIFERSGSAKSFANVLGEIGASEAVKSIIILSCESNGFTPQCINDALRSAGRPIIGGTFPMIAENGTVHEKGTLFIGLPFSIRTHIFSVSHMQEGHYIPELPSPEECMAIIFVDGLSENVLKYCTLVHDTLGVGVKMIGGGAGSLDFKPKPCLMTNEGLIGDACIMGLASVPCGVGVTHGWTTASRQLEVTESEGKRIISLDWRPAGQVYGEIVNDLSSISISEGDFFEQAKGHPLGIISMGSEVVVRDLIALDGDCLRSVSDIEPRTIVSILKGDHGTLLESARSCPVIAQMDLGNSIPQISLLMDCISRCLFLGESMSEELEELTIEDIPLVGAFTIGEIACDGKTMMEFHNKTTALALLGA